MAQRCFLIADDLTGGADAGAQFAKRALNTLLVLYNENERINFSKYTCQDVLVVNTDSRGLSPEKASSLLSNLFRNYKKEIFPIIYKKIDSTLRGNIGYEIDAILKEMNGSLCFMAPSYPEQNRRLVGGIMMVGEKPLAFSEAVQHTTSPVQESHVFKILQDQSHNHVGWIDLTHVASSSEGLLKAVREEKKRGSKIIIFDAVSRQDLKHIADVGFSIEPKPLFVGSAGLAEEVAKQLSPSRKRVIQGIRPFKHILVVSGSASSITHQQLRRIENKDTPSFEITKSLIFGKGTGEEKELSEKVASSLSLGITILKTPSKIIASKDSTDPPLHQRITKALATIVLLAIRASKIKPSDLTFVLTGGETAQHIINGLGPEEIKIEGELLEGIVKGHLRGGNWDGLTVVTKAGAFGKEDALKRIISMIRMGSSMTEEEGKNESPVQR